jgi:predicted XRE-type DNA-binding protein
MLKTNEVKFSLLRGKFMSNQLYHRGSGNVYKDLDFPNAEEMQAKASLASRILSIVEEKGWTQEKAARILGITQPKVSLLTRGQFSGFSLGKLIGLLNKLNQDIEIVVKNKSVSLKHTGHVSVTYASV